MSKKKKRSAITDRKKETNQLIKRTIAESDSVKVSRKTKIFRVNRNSKRREKKKRT